MITIIDYRAGNPESVKNMLKKAGAPSVITSDQDTVAKADKLILPGVGHFDYGMKRLAEAKLIEPMRHAALDRKIPFLGICLGAQLMTEGSEEGTEPGLGWIPGKTIKFEFDAKHPDLKVPHMGWSDVFPKKDSRLLQGMHADPRFYFVHAFHLKPARPEDVLLTSEYGFEFIAAFEHENLIGVQFHPEKSHKFGMKLLQNFVELC